MLDAASAGKRRNPFVFVVGCPRSGTTLLQRILDAHPLLAVANDSHFVPRCLESVAPHLVAPATRGETLGLTDEMIESVVGYHRFHRLGIAEADGRRAARGAASYDGYVSALYDAFATQRRKPLGGEKTPDYVRRLPLLGGLFPEARFVHIVRDGRDVALSVMNWAHEGKGPGKLDLWADSPAATSALWWAWQVGTGCRDGRALGGRYLELRYERLVESPEEESQRLTEFLGIPFAPEMLRFHEGKMKSNPDASAKSNWLPPTPGLRNWRTEMKPEELALFERLAGDLLDDLGMERARDVPAAEIEDKAAAYAARWFAHLQRKEQKRERRVKRALAGARA